MNLPTLSALVLVGALSFAILFEVAVVAGAPFGAFTAGGKYPGKLPAKARLQRFWFIFGWSILLGHYLAQAGVLTPLLSASLNEAVNWVFASTLAMAIYFNSRSNSVKERALWMPVVMVMLICALLVAVK
ncbi:MAG: hypothetical protein ACKORF_02450 [Micrococcales bacterium]